MGIVATVALCAVLVGIGVYRKRVGIQFHKWRVTSLLNEKPKRDLEVGLSYYDERWSQAFEKHRDRLVELGFLERREFLLSNIKPRSEQFRRLWQTLGETFADNPYTVGDAWDPNEPVVITVFDNPEKLSEWARIISAQDRSAGKEH